MINGLKGVPLAPSSASIDTGSIEALGRGLAYFFVIGFGLLIGAFAGLIASLMIGLITMAC